MTTDAKNNLWTTIKSCPHSSSTALTSCLGPTSVGPGGGGVICAQSLVLFLLQPLNHGIQRTGAVHCLLTHHLVQAWRKHGSGEKNESEAWKVKEKIKQSLNTSSDAVLKNGTTLLWYDWKHLSTTQISQLNTIKDTKATTSPHKSVILPHKKSLFPLWTPSPFFAVLYKPISLTTDCFCLYPCQDFTTALLIYFNCHC